MASLAEILGYAPAVLGTAGTIGGAIAGSVIPGAGTVAGAGIGGAVGAGLGGILGYAGQSMTADEQRKQAEQQMAAQKALDAQQEAELKRQAREQAAMNILSNFL